MIEHKPDRVIISSGEGLHAVITECPPERLPIFHQMALDEIVRLKEERRDILRVLGRWLNNPYAKAAVAPECGLSDPDGNPCDCVYCASLNVMTP